MKKYTAAEERSDVRSVAARWDKQYPYSQLQNIYQAECVSETAKKADNISKALHALDVESATAEDVELIIGNSSWVRLPVCENCGKVTRQAVGFGTDDFEDQTHWACIDCLRDAVRLLEIGLPLAEIG